MRRVFLGKISPIDLLRRYIRKKLWRFFDWNQNYFLKPNDGISQSPIRGEMHDEEVVEALIFLSRYLPDNFLDVGANIGLVSLALSNHVENIFCIEPNPIVASVLRANLALNCQRFSVHEFALGEADTVTSMYYPRYNLGGAFILEDNQYDSNALARKDGFSFFDESNYLKQRVIVKDRGRALSVIGENISSSLLVKLDIEGMENLVLDSIIGIFARFFNDAKIALVFESHDSVTIEHFRRETEKWGFEVYGLKMASSHKKGIPLIRRIRKLVSGDKREILFIPLGELSPSHKVTNFLCCHPRLLVN